MKEKIKRILLKLNYLNIARKFNPFWYFRYQLNHKKKQDVLLDLKKSFSLNILIETGTYLGDMVYAMEDKFRHIYSIELGEELYNNAVKRFEGKEDITILNGDSSDILFKIMPTFKESCLFWLDAHYSDGVTAKGDNVTPIIKELEIILKQETKGHVIAIDDAVSFVGKNGYPTIDAIRDIVINNSRNYQMEIANGIIKIYPIK